MTAKPPEVVGLIELAHGLAVKASGRPAPDAAPGDRFNQWVDVISTLDAAHRAAKRQLIRVGDLEAGRHVHEKPADWDAPFRHIPVERGQ
jgi:hypothetical protein